MKKLLVLALVLSMATMASAALTLKINVSGAVANQDGSYTVQPSDNITIGITTPAGVLTDDDEGDFVMVSDIALGAIAGGAVENSNTWWANTLADDAVTFGAPVPDGMNGVAGSVALFGYTIPAASLLFSGINFHCEGIGDTTIQIWQHDWSTPVTLLDSVVIHQIPEPITMTLLGLGGLFLRRRSK
jgi:hypothetical protein